MDALQQRRFLDEPAVEAHLQRLQREARAIREVRFGFVSSWTAWVPVTADATSSRGVAPAIESS